MKKQIMLALVLALCMLQSSFAISGQDGNGGGGICLSSKCYTLAEAGLRIPVEPVKQSWLPSAEVVKELETIEKSLPFTGLELTAKVIGTAKTYHVVEALNDKKFLKTIVRDYNEQITKAGFSPEGRLEIFAISLPQYRGDSWTGNYLLPVNFYNSITYILPSFFRLNVRQQALILIHEANIRAGRNLEFALRFDGILLDYLNNKAKASYDPFLLYGVLNTFSGNQYMDFIWSQSLTLLEQRNNRRMTLADFVQTDNYNSFIQYLRGGGVDVYKTTALSLIKGAKLSANFANVFSQTSYSLRPTKATLFGLKEACQQVAGATGYSQWIIIPTSDQGRAYTVNCGNPLTDGSYEAGFISADNINTLNGSL